MYPCFKLLKGKLRYEYWPWWLFFLPMVPVWAFYAIKSGRWFYFTNVNPGIDLGGFFGESKIEIIRSMDDQYTADTLFVAKTKGELYSSHELPFGFPIVCKPDVGERGYMVEIVSSQEALRDYHHRVEGDYLIQEMVDWPIECGVLFVKHPDKTQGQVTSLTLKRFLKVTGNGVDTVHELMQSDPRQALYADKFAVDYIPAKGEKYVVQPIGNHCLGTEFIDGGEHLDKEVHQLFTTIASRIPGFHYGRFDLKVKTYDDLRTGNWLKIFELNGVSGEPGHMYDKRYNVLDAYRILRFHWGQIYQISKKNIRLGIEPASFGVVVKRVYQHFSHKKAGKNPA